ncbi:ABC-2 type transport system permease protein [Cohnella sp. OV330]|uniref:ABC transporter permease n=1 Tax=Cohnella sp. OV330 TaxID=1855288 RepID=UPI0008E158FE|nr:ABC transporter permease [Cohnella sp. OV330]SFA93893.1 ABC-2 type transport system permease protein [Cohnella sp. OV330]
MADPVHEEKPRGLGDWRRERASAFRREMFPYLRYVAQSGFAMLLAAIGITLLAGYAGLLADMPTEWPADVVGVALIFFASIYTPLRSYLQPADTVFLLPAESGVLSANLFPALRKSALFGAIRTLVVFVVFAPLYALAPVTADAAPSQPAAWAALAAALALFAAWNTYAAWQERRAVSATARLALRFARWTAVLLAAAALLTKPLLLAAGFALLAAAAVSAAALLTPRHRLPWDRLIAEEGAVRRRWLSFLGWFVDIPTEAPPAASRAWIAWIADRVPRDRRFAWHFLYAKTFLRGEAFGAFWRWCALMAVIALFAHSTAVDVMVYVVGMVVGGLQLTELGRIRFAEHASVVPLSPDGRNMAASAVVRAAGLAAAALLWLVAWVPHAASAPTWWLIALALALGWTGWLLPRRLAARDEEEEL